MKAADIRAKYLAFFQSRGHAVIPAAPIIPPDDPTTLFTSSGMQQLVPYLKGEDHPMGTRLVNSQPSFRAEDIEEVGDNRHTCMFEMLGNWSLGDYFKKDQLAWVWEFFTNELGLDKSRLYITVFAGDAGVEEDQAAIKVWQEILGDSNSAQPGEKGFDPKTKIYTYASNWWSRSGGPDKMPVGEIGGPDSEIFFDFGESHNFHAQSVWADELCHVNCDCGRFLEIGNSVFMQYEKTDDGMVPLPAQNVDFGGGFGRIVAAVADSPDVFTTDIFEPTIKSIEKITGKKYSGEFMPAMRVIADHIRAAVFMAAQGLTPSNKLQGYVMRRLLRRAAVRARTLGGDTKEIFLASVPSIIEFYSQASFINSEVEQKIIGVISEELDKFTKVLEKGSRAINKLGEDQITEQIAFDLYQSMGFPFEITKELVEAKGVTLDESKFNQLLSAHKDSSRTSSAGMFKGGLADSSEITTQYHTTTHILHQALIDVLGDEVTQAGSNISAHRLRFDYTYSGKPTEEERTKIQDLINQKISEDLPVHKTIQDKQDALDSGARAFFVEKYPERVTVYTIGLDEKEDWYSKELCGGPHVARTGEIGEIKITKDENLGSGKRRIYAELT